MYALLLGFVLMHEKVPNFIIRYIRKNRPDTIFGKVWIALSSLAGAPNVYDEVLRSLVIKSLE